MLNHGETQTAGLLDGRTANHARTEAAPVDRGGYEQMREDSVPCVPPEVDAFLCLDVVRLSNGGHWWLALGCVGCLLVELLFWVNFSATLAAGIHVTGCSFVCLGSEAKARFGGILWKVQDHQTV